VEIADVTWFGLAGVGGRSEEMQPVPLEVWSLVGVLGEKPGGERTFRSDESHAGPAVLSDNGLEPLRVVAVDPHHLLDLGLGGTVAADCEGARVLIDIPAPTQFGGQLWLLRLAHRPTLPLARRPETGD
jgi:hypothetical protein